MKSKVMTLALAGFLFAGFASADESLKAEIADLKAKVASMESARMAPAAGGDAASLTSMKKKGNIQIGGAVQIDVAVIEVEKVEDTQGQLNDNDELTKTYFGTGLPYDSFKGAYLDFQINASADTFLYIQLDLDDFWNATADQDDLLEQVYFRWNKVRASNFDVVFGKKAVDYGQDKYVGVTPSFHDGWTYLFQNDFAVLNETVAGTGSVATHGLPTAPSNTFQIEGIYHYKDLLNVYATVFQDPTSRGMHEDRSDDSLFFESWAIKAELMPMEGLVVSASMINRHNESRSEGTDENEDNQYAFSLAADYTFKRIPLNIWGEYQHGFDWGYFSDISCDIFSIGATYGVTENIDVSLLTEYAGVQHPNATYGATTAAQIEDEDYYQAVLTGTYKFDNGMSMSLEYARQWYNADLQSANDQGRDAEVIAFRTAWSF